MLFEMFNEKIQKENLDWIKKRKQSNLSRYKQYSKESSNKDKKFEIERDFEVYNEELLLKPLFFF